MKTKEIIQKNFSGGISDDIRQPSGNMFSISQHFDIFTSPNKLIPYRDWVANDTGHLGILSFLWDGTYVYGLGIRMTGGFAAQIYRKNSLTSDWQEAPNAHGSTGYLNVPGELFILYKGFIYHWVLTGTLNRYEIVTSIYTEAFKSLGCTNRAQGLVHSKTDTLYIPRDNIISQMDGTVWTDTRLTLPSNCVITALVEYGNYLAIFTRPNVSGVTNSKVYLWDMESDDVTDILDFGAGDLYIGGIAGGRLIGIMNEAITGTNNIPFVGVTFSKQKVFVKSYSGGSVTLFKTFEDAGLLSGYSIGLISTGRSFIQNNNGLSFVMTSSGLKVPTGIYTISSIGEGYSLAVTSERNIFNATTIAGSIGAIPLPGVQGIFRVGNMWFVSFNPVWAGGAGDLQNVSTHIGRTDENADRTFPAFIETQIYDIGDPSGNYELAGVSEFCTELPSGASVTFKYRVSQNDAWTTIYVHNTPGEVSHDAICLEAGANIGDNLEQFSEVQFRLESLGGAEITGYLAIVNILKTLLG